MVKTVNLYLELKKKHTHIWKANVTIKKFHLTSYLL